MLVVGVVHGTETGGIPIARALARLSPPDLDLWIVPDLNPDGVAGGVRQNARGVDLNRNFPWHWRPMSGVYESGPRPLSEREARIAHALILREILKHFFRGTKSLLKNIVNAGQALDGLIKH